MRPFLIVFSALLLFAGAASSSGLDILFRAEIDRLAAPPPAGGDAPMMGGRAGRSPHRAFFYSLLLPGLGQMYGSGWDLRSWTAARGVSYGAFEVYGWMRRQDNHGRGLDKQTEYREFADRNWMWREDCADWNGGEGAIDDDPFVEGDVGPDGADWYIDTEPEWLEFYEDIHKLQKWICGWNDYLDHRILVDPEHELYQTPMQLEHRAMRQDQNDKMATADHWVWAIMINHIASAFDAYYLVKQTGGGEGGAQAGVIPSVRLGEPMTGTGATVALAWSF